MHSLIYYIILNLFSIDLARGIIWLQPKPSSQGWLMPSPPSIQGSSTCVGHSNGHSFEGFSCPLSKRCYPLTWRCDGHDDCPGGEDEKYCRYPIRPTYPSDTGNPRCRIGELACVSSNGRDVCLSRRKVCDGFVDCYDGWDENVANCEPSNCSFRCSSNGPCLNVRRRCDGIRDCYNGADERYCNLNNVHEHHEEIDEEEEEEDEDEDEDRDQHESSFCHSEYEFKCWESSGRKCIARAWVCDGHDDCPEGEDEEHCDSHHPWRTLPLLLI